MKWKPVCQLEFTLAELLWDIRRQRFRRLRLMPGDDRAAIEATVPKHPSEGNYIHDGSKPLLLCRVGLCRMNF